MPQAVEMGVAKFETRPTEPPPARSIISMPPRKAPAAKTSRPTWLAVGSAGRAAISEAES